jgi:hypothetical protein
MPSSEHSTIKVITYYLNNSLFILITKNLSIWVANKISMLNMQNG